MTVGAFLAALYLSKGLSLLIPMHLCVFIGERSGGFEKAFLTGGAALLLPAAAYRFGADGLRSVTALSLLSDGNLLLSGGTGMTLFLVWMVLSLAALLAARRDWCRIS